MRPNTRGADRARGRLPPAGELSRGRRRDNGGGADLQSRRGAGRSGVETGRGTGEAIGWGTGGGLLLGKKGIDTGVSLRDGRPAEEGDDGVATGWGPAQRLRRRCPATMEDPWLPPLRGKGSVRRGDRTGWVTGGWRLTGWGPDGRR